MKKRGYTIKDNRIIADEDRVHAQVVTWLKLKHPTILFHTDAAGELMLESMRMRQGRLNIKGISFPDLQIMAAHRGYFGLLIEMKREGEELYNTAGLFKNEHLSRQDCTLKALTERNYLAVFAKGFDAIVKIIDEYLSGPPTQVKKAKK
ncbi:MAG TPA: hypothetical protein VKQ08_11135 [Cyclobacteriaceae bacterium]|nr:hypothetical protein [Cyclobacteriaceae bacterium]